MPPKLAPGRGGSRRGGSASHSRASSGGASRGSRPGPAPSLAAHHESIATHVRRPNFGTAGRPYTIQVNSFEVTVPESFIFHYDVVEPDRFPARFNLELFKRLQDAEGGVFNPKVVYDGKKNVFSPRELPLGESGSRKFALSSVPARGDRPPKVNYITLTKVNKINTETLHRFVRGQQPHDETVLTSITALNVVVRMNPISKYPFDKRSFYTPQDRKILGNGLELWRGIFQSIRPTIGKLVLNVDLKAGVMYKAGPLIRLCLEFLGRDVTANPVGLLSPDVFPRPRRHELKKFLMGLRIQVRSTGNKMRAITGLSEESANSITFDLDGVQTTVAQYYRRANLPLTYPGIICVQVGRSAMVPLEMCNVPPGQISKRQLSDAQLKSLQEFSTIKPEERLQRIVTGLSSLRNGNGDGETDYVEQFGMTIGTEPLTNPMRLITPPTMRYGDNSKERTVNLRVGSGSWNMVDKKFYRPATLQRWVILVYDSRFSEDDQKRIIASFLKACNELGINVQHREPVVVNARPHANHEEQFKNAGNLCNRQLGGLPALVVVVLPSNAADIYRAIKHLAYTKFGVPTQCLKSINCIRGNQQYWNNVLLKVNTKLGGINAVAESDTISEFLKNASQPTIIIGADVIHPAPGTVAKPSYTSVVGSLDSHAVKYVPTTSVQEGRQEMIADMKGMCKHILDLHMSYRENVEKAGNAKVPKRLIYFRDGVSEGQFQQVLESNEKSTCKSELESIKEACRELKINPKISVIVVGKRHHNQLFGGNNGPPKDKSQNCPAGSVLDSGIVHPTDFEFILQSHAGILGTSRPAYYHVIHDEIGFRNADSVHALAFALCHTYARCTRSVSIPAPVYYADILCSKAKYHFHPSFDPDFSDTATQTSRGRGAGSAAGSYLETYKRQFQKLHLSLTRSMYFV